MSKSVRWAVEDPDEIIHIVVYDGNWWGTENLGMNSSPESKYVIRETIKWFMEKDELCGFYKGYTWVQL